MENCEWREHAEKNLSAVKTMQKRLVKKMRKETWHSSQVKKREREREAKKKVDVEFLDLISIRMYSLLHSFFSLT